MAAGLHGRMDTEYIKEEILDCEAVRFVLDFIDTR